MTKSAFYKKLETYCATLEGEFDKIPDERKAALTRLGGYISTKNKAGEVAQLTVICTHNSRRSHFGQAWLAVASTYFGIEAATFSGGTEATAFHPNAVASLQRSGLKINRLDDSSNPIYEMKIGPKYHPSQMFSKKYDHPSNPQRSFAAIMVCSEADAGCPFVPGADGRFAMPYFDPKLADGSASEAQVYDERCRQMATEMFFVVRQAMAGE